MTDKTRLLGTMAENKPSKRKTQPLSHGRPPFHKATKQLSSRTTRDIIRNHHQLSKLRAHATSEGNEEVVDRIEQQIAKNGGLSQYQLASKLGQCAERGGDSSKVLVEWMMPVVNAPNNSNQGKLRILEVGALSVNNACSKVLAFHVERIDLHAQEAGIMKQDFMEMSIPTGPDSKYHVISLSLVLNFLPDPIGRGNMLRRLPKFLSGHQSFPDLLPCVFLVLPASCVTNSRYLTEARLKDIMASIGFSCIRWKLTPKLVYSLWIQDGKWKDAHFKKEQLRPGGKRNNFAIVLR